MAAYTDGWLFEVWISTYSSGFVPCASQVVDPVKASYGVENAMYAVVQVCTSLDVDVLYNP